MKIIIITEIMAPYRVAWFNELGKKAELDVFYLKETEESREDDWLSLRPHTCKYTKARAAKMGRHSISFSLLKELKKDYDIVIFDGYGLISNIMGILYMNYKKRDFFINVDGGLGKTDEPIIQRLIKRMVLANAFVLCSSETAKQYVMSYGAKERKCFIHPFTSLMHNDLVDQVPGQKTKNILKAELGISEPFIVLSVGRFINIKGYDVLLRSCQYLSKGVGVYIVGGNPPNEYLKLRNDLNLANVHFVGFKRMDQLKRYYQSADLFVLPTRGDVWGLVVNEAMANGLPVITTDKCVAGLELVKDFENGFIVPTEDHITLAEKMNHVLNDDYLRREMSTNNLKKIKEYTIENMARVQINFFEDYIEKKGSHL